MWGILAVVSDQLIEFSVMMRAIEFTATRGTKLILHIRSGQAFVDWRRVIVSREKTMRNNFRISECEFGIAAYG